MFNSHPDGYSIITHHYTLEYKDNSDMYLSDFIKTSNLWFSNHELSDLHDDLLAMKNLKSKGDEEPLYKCFILVNKILFDFYQHLGGNNKVWAISKEFDKLLRKAISKKQISWKVKESLRTRLSNVFEHTGRGKNFSRPVSEIWVAYRLEQLYVDIVFYLGLAVIPEHELLKVAYIKKQVDNF